jgi:hypothetical protein
MLDGLLEVKKLARELWRPRAERHPLRQRSEARVALK